MLPFWVSIAALSLVQGALVAVPGRERRRPRPAGVARLSVLSARGWAVVPAASVLVFVIVARGAEHASAQGLTYLALVAVPVLATLALGWLAHGARPAYALLVPALFALAWVDRGGLAGELCAVALTALSCASLGRLLAAVTPARWLGAGIVAMALADTALVIADLLQRPNGTLNAAHPAAGLPRLQSAELGSAVMGYGDLFIAGVLGGLLAAVASRRVQLSAAALTALLALALDLLFFAFEELPATVPVALCLVALVLRARLGAQRATGGERLVARSRAAAERAAARPARR